MKIFKFMLIFALFAGIFGGALEAKVVTTTTTKTSQGEGTGITREEAINNAIIEAVGKMSGVHINSRQLSATNMTSDANGAQISDHYAQTINKATKGRADSYEILEASENNGRWHAVVEIKKSTTTKKYQAPGLSADSRRSITVFDASGAEWRGSKLATSVQQSVINHLNASRKFNVLDRDSGGYYEMEKAIIKSGDAGGDEIYKLKNVLATDYILLFNIKEAAATAKKSNLTGRTKNKAEVWVDFRVILFATRQIKFSDSVSLTIDAKDGGIAATASTVDQVGKAIATKVVDQIYPAKIASISGSGENAEAVFTQSIENGAILECFTLGEKIKDAYTGEGARVETKSGEVEITRQSAKTSYAKITSGAPKKGDICRTQSSSGPGVSVGRDANYKLGESGGVDLGW